MNAAGLVRTRVFWGGLGVRSCCADALRTVARKGSLRCTRSRGSCASVWAAMQSSQRAVGRLKVLRLLTATYSHAWRGASGSMVVGQKKSCIPTLGGRCKAGPLRAWMASQSGGVLYITKPNPVSKPELYRIAFCNEQTLDTVYRLLRAGERERTRTNTRTHAHTAGNAKPASGAGSVTGTRGFSTRASSRGFSTSATAPPVSLAHARFVYGTSGLCFGH